MALARFDGIAPRAGSTVTVYAFGTLDLVLLFEDGDGVTPLGNPFTADMATGVYVFWTQDIPLNIDLNTTDGVPLATPVENALLSLSFTGVRPFRHAKLIAFDEEEGITVVMAEQVY